MFSILLLLTTTCFATQVRPLLAFAQNSQIQNLAKIEDLQPCFKLNLVFYRDYSGELNTSLSIPLYSHSLVDDIKSICGNVAEFDSLDDADSQGTRIVTLKEFDQSTIDSLSNAVVYFLGTPSLVLQKRLLGSNSTFFKNRSIFQKYVFLNNGLFHGIFIVILFVMFLYFGISIISSVQTGNKMSMASSKKTN